ncbi:urea amidolyase [Yamadazyma tenuis]|uniref:Urea amidolyase n=1 Tax=Candida tenuis (strain ATCC 10573 / BCRC 21748 / CBS 615 / JCM 9827 / NBRC 10315 / NRRL Y-1498 / VKM Y-70) TaxID=590646 RepID=G3B9J6_CANTC|nr:urea carboxylase [Yamadazyma tenuis ATCC 10573]EGV61905.1 urea carboxylase [Yamadazyma tenuis ATCC 10573]WEJ93139.1 urea amidolyase [Yamadazyma tenuis]
MSYIGWSIQDWVKFHSDSTPEQSFALLSQVLTSQSSDDPAWISLVSPANLQHQWDFLQSNFHKTQLPLYGVPVAIKDNIDVKYLETTAACPSFAYDPQEDATTVKLLRDQGAIIIGKTNLDQFATGLVGTRSPYGVTPNTFNAKYVSGGSSAGSASVVARGIVPIALGTDTAGSGRVPAALNNLIGLKPTKGIFSCKGVVPACKSLDCVSIFALNLQDAQLCLDIMAKFDGDNDEYSRSLPTNPLRAFYKPTIGIPNNLLWYGEEENPKVYNKAVSVFEKLNFELKSVNIDPFLALARLLYEGPWVTERFVATEEFFQTNPPEKDLDPTVTQIIKGGEKYTAANCFKSEYKRQALLQQINKIMNQNDVIIVPTCPLNPSIEQIQKEPVKINSYQGTYTNFVNLADLSALSIPAGFRSDGLPFGITLLSKKFNDFALLDLANQFLKANSKNRFAGCLTDVLIGAADELNASLPKPNPQTSIELAVVGAHLKGFELHWQLQKVNAAFVKQTKTSKNYKLYCLPKTGPVMKPGLRRVNPEEVDGAQITIEVYSIPVETFGDFIRLVPQPLGIGSVELEDGSYVKSFICEESGYKAPGTIEITKYGGWAKYIHYTKSQAKKPFNSVLVANRGEIAYRIIKTLKKLGVKSIAVYSDLDKYAKHVLEADVGIPLHGRSAAETYISIDKIIKAAKDSGAEAIIPGYGFLSENADFSDRCGKEGIVFVGPSGDAIRKLGLKHSAREIAQTANVPLVPGSNLIKDAKEAREVANKLEYPVMVKSTAGGGGIGLQKCDSEDEIERIFETVQHQGKSYFGDDGVFLERFVENARHVEIQILGDGYGKAIALGERDCSLQRRNQKVIEETPAPNLPEATRQKMRKAGESLASVLKYKCAGTVEFIYDEKRDEFYFLEVNARLQVEHPITEMVTGFDLVEWMLLIAADMAPPLDEQEITVTGASMEARLYAENPVKDFMPSPGQLTEVKFPEWARIDGWVEKGTVVSAEYDPTLAKIIVHGKDRNEALLKLRKALNETVVYGCITNVDYLRSIANSKMFENCQMHTKILDTYKYQPTAFEVLQPGAYTTVQDYPGRKGYWHIGVPPSGCMDDYAFRLGNRIVGNHKKAPGIEITLNGPKILFHHDTIVAVTGGEVDVDVNGVASKQWEPITIKAGDKLSIGKLSSGCRAYLTIRGGIDVTEYMGSRSTFALGNLGGYNGRVLKLGDVLFLGQPELPSCTLPSPISKPTSIPSSLIPSYDFNSKKAWKVGITCGPHGSPDFFQKESVIEFLSSEWKVHYNSNRFGVRLIGPKPKWARPDGGEAGLHPSNAHDYVYSLGAINFTGDEPVILTCDGPSLGGFVCQAVVAEAEMWKIGQVKPGDMIQFVPLSWEDAKSLKHSQDSIIEELKGELPDKAILPKKLNGPEDPVLYTFKASSNAPKVVYRQAGDRYILVEYGDNVLDLNLSYRIYKLMEIIQERKTPGIVEMSQGVRSVLIEFDGITQENLLKLLVSIEKEIIFINKWKVSSRIVKLPMAFEDQKTMDAVKRYSETIRSDAPWLPNNVDFIASINGIDRKDVKDMLYSARFLVLGLGDVFLGAPCAVPLDPRHRLLGTKYNPSRTFTPNGTVGIGGNYMCIYTMESPGGYQLVGRTIPIWDKLTLGTHSTDKPWLLSAFDQVEFYPVSEAEIDKFSEEMNAGKFKVDIVESVFDHSQYLEWVQEHTDSIDEFLKNQGGDKLEEFNRLIQVSNADLATSSQPTGTAEENFGENAEKVYSEYSGRFWKPLAEVGQQVKTGDGLIVVEAMKTEMVVSATKDGKVVKIFHKNGDMVEAGDLVVVIE